MNDAVVIIPTYEERENIGQLLEELYVLNTGVDVLVVDDCSPDKTAEVVRMHQQKYPQWGLRLMSRAQRTGLGAAYRSAFRCVLAEGYQYIMQMDGDFSHNPRDIPKLLTRCRKEGGLVIGSRYVKGVNVVNWPMGRVLLSYGANRYIQLVTGMRVHDATSGFVCYHRDALQQVVSKQSHLTGGYAFQVEAKFEAWKHGFPIREVSIVFTDRIRGRSKMSGQIFWEAFFAVIRMRVRSFFTKYPPRKTTQ